MRAWVIGGRSGIGLATTVALTNANRFVSQTDKGVDVRDYLALTGFIRHCGPFDDVVFSAGINRLSWIKDLNEDLMIRILRTNLVGFTNVMRALLNEQPDHPARIVVVTSDAAVRPMRGSLAYCASKAALEMAVKVAARELGRDGWRINSVAPGMTEPTKMQAQLDRDIPKFRGWTPEQAREYENSQNPLGRRATTSEVAAVILDVLQMPDYVNGATFTVNGGR